MLSDDLRAFAGRRLEQGAPLAWPLAGPARLLAAAWETWSARGVARPLRLPDGVRVIGVGGAVLGGAGKSPLAIALVRSLAERGQRPVLVGHAYRGRPRGARVVRPGDSVAEVGDDALASARLLGEVAPVVVGPSRQAAVDLAAALGHPIIVVDGLLQAAPGRLAAGILVLDALAPWGAGRCPPLGDLKAPRAALLAAADRVVALHPEGALRGSAEALPPGTLVVPARIAGAVPAEGAPVPLSALRDRRLGLILAVARPHRVVDALAREGIHPVVRRILGDHAVPDLRLLDRAAPVDAWLTTARCATKLPGAIGGRPVLALDHRVDVGALVPWLPC